MVEGRTRARWDHTASIMAIVAEVNRNPKKRSRPYRPADFHPYAKPDPGGPTDGKVKMKMKDVKDLLSGLRPGGR